MVAFITFTTLTHAAFYVFDEYILHKKRAYSQKEINSGILDAILYLSAVGLTLFTTFSETLGYVYLVLGILSCVSIVKNELFYQDLSQKERFTHAMLYILHPIILYAFYISWQQNFFTTNLNYWMLQLGYFALGWKALTYHIIYWNYIHNK